MTRTARASNAPIRVVFLGTSEFAAVLLTSLCSDPRFQIPLVVTQPPRPHGRGLRIFRTPVAVEAERSGLEVEEPSRLRTRAFRSLIGATEPDFLVVASYGRILPREVLSIARIAPINVHASLLPAYRGAAPIQRAIMDGLDETGVTTMWMDEGIDTGDTLLTRRVPIAIDDDAAQLTMKLAAAGADLLPQTLQGVMSGSVLPHPQDHARATYAPPIASDDCVVRWDRPARQVHDQVRALSPRPGAAARFCGKRVKILRALPQDGPSPGPGVVACAERSSLLVGTATGLVRLIEVQPESGRAMGATDWSRGARVAVGSAFDVAGSP